MADDFCMFFDETVKKHSFQKWMKAEGYVIQPGVMEYKPNLTIVLKTVTFLKYNELMDFYNFKFADEEKNLELVRDIFCFMAPNPEGVEEATLKKVLELLKSDR